MSMVSMNLTRTGFFFSPGGKFKFSKTIVVYCSESVVDSGKTQISNGC